MIEAAARCGGRHLPAVVQEGELRPRLLPGVRAAPGGVQAHPRPGRRPHLLDPQSLRQLEVGEGGRGEEPGEEVLPLGRGHAQSAGATLATQQRGPAEEVALEAGHPSRGDQETRTEEEGPRLEVSPLPAPAQLRADRAAAVRLLADRQPDLPRRPVVPGERRRRERLRARAQVAAPGGAEEAGDQRRRFVGDRLPLADLLVLGVVPGVPGIPLRRPRQEGEGLAVRGVRKLRDVAARDAQRMRGTAGAVQLAPARQEVEGEALLLHGGRHVDHVQDLLRPGGCGEGREGRARHLEPVEDRVPGRGRGGCSRPRRLPALRQTALRRLGVEAAGHPSPRSPQSALPVRGQEGGPDVLAELVPVVEERAGAGRPEVLPLPSDLDGVVL